MSLEINPLQNLLVGSSGRFQRLHNPVEIQHLGHGLAGLVAAVPLVIQSGFQSGDGDSAHAQLEGHSAQRRVFLLAVPLCFKPLVQLHIGGVDLAYSGAAHVVVKRVGGYGGVFLIGNYLYLGFVRPYIKTVLIQLKAAQLVRGHKGDDLRPVAPGITGAGVHLLQPENISRPHDGGVELAVHLLSAQPIQLGARLVNVNQGAAVQHGFQSAGQRCLMELKPRPVHVFVRVQLFSVKGARSPFILKCNRRPVLCVFIV